MTKIDRNPKTVLDALCKVWVKYPDLRVGQIISNAVSEPGKEYTGDLLFFIENRPLADLLLKFYEVDDD
jgi:hypothetical protein